MFSDFLVFQNQNNFFYFLGNAGDSVMKAANSLFGKKERKHASNEGFIILENFEHFC